MFKKISPFEWRRAQSDTAVGNKIQVKIRIIWNAHWQSITDEQTESYHKRFCMRGSQCASRQTIATLLRRYSSAAPCGHRLRCRYPNSGGGYSVASYILSSLREERLGEKGGAFLNGKEGRVGFRKSYVRT